MRQRLRSYAVQTNPGVLHIDSCGQVEGIDSSLPGSTIFTAGNLQLGLELTMRGLPPTLLTPANAEPQSCIQTESGLLFTGGLQGIVVHVAVKVDSTGPHWEVRLTNTSDGMLDSFAFRLGGKWDRLTAPTCTVPLLAGWALPLTRLETGDSLTMAYPVRAAMQWVDLFTPSAGVYFGCHDPLPLYKELTITRDKQLCQVSWNCNHLNLVPGASVDLPPVYLVLHPGDWHTGADIYRSWARGQYAPPVVPAWYSACPAWAWTGLRGQLECTPWRTTADLPAISQLAGEAGIDTLQVTAYNETGHDTQYPDYAVGASNDGEVGMRQAVAQIHSAGRRITMYANGRIVDPASSLTPEQRAAWAVRSTPDGQVARETYGKVIFDILCPGAADWRELFIDRLDQLVEAYGIDGIFIDQVSAATSLPCYAESHGHAAPNQAWAYYRQLLHDLRVRLKQLNPDLVLSSEGISDIFGCYLDSQQAHQDWPIPLQPKTMPLDNLFRYTFPDYLLNSGCITADAPGYHYLKVAHLLGSGFDVGIADFAQLSPSFRQALQFAIQWRKRWADTLSLAPKEVTTRQPGLKANRFSPREGQITFILTLAWLPLDDEQPKPAEFELELPCVGATSQVQVQVFTPEGTLPVTTTSGRQSLTLRMPFTEVAGLVINRSADRT